MNREEEITRLLAVAGEKPLQSPPCPDEHQVAGYVDGGLDAAERRKVEGHLAACSHCVQLVALLLQERQAAGAEPAPGSISPAAGRARQRWWPLPPQWAAAAAAVLAVPLLYVVLGRPGGEGPASVQRGDTATDPTRSIRRAEIGVQVFPPPAGSADGPAFRWTAVAGTPFYDVRIVDDEGNVLIRERVTGTAWTAPAQLGLQPGGDYYVHVDAYPAGNKVVSSDHVLFKAAD